MSLAITLLLPLPRATPTPIRFIRFYRYHRTTKAGALSLLQLCLCLWLCLWPQYYCLFRLGVLRLLLSPAPCGLAPLVFLSPLGLAWPTFNLPAKDISASSFFGSLLTFSSFGLTPWWPHSHFYLLSNNSSLHPFPCFIMFRNSLQKLTCLFLFQTELTLRSSVYNVHTVCVWSC